MRVLLLNPPSPDLVIRDYYCSKTTKSNYLFQPVDLLVQSGLLSREFEVRLIDAVVERLSPEACVAKVLELRPDAIFFLSGAISWTYDFPFLADLKARLGGRTKLVGSGDIFLEEGERWLAEFPALDAVVMDFSLDDVGNYLRGRDEALENIVYRRDGEIRAVSRPRARGGDFDLPVPRHELFQNPGYKFSFVRAAPFATVLTDYGCPFPCTFCVMSGLGSKFRSVPNVLEELRLLRSLGVREVFFIDQTWGVRRERNRELCERMIAEDLRLGWVTYTRADILRAEDLELWRRAGCHTLMMGVESASPQTLKAYRKGYKAEQVASGLRMVRAAGIRTVGTFIIGLPEDTRETIEATIRLACELPLDFASFNVAVPRFGTLFRAQAKANGLIDDLRVMDQAGETVAMPTRTLSREEVLELKRSAIHRFYLRPSYLLRRLISVGSLWELKAQVTEGLALLSRNVGAPRRDASDGSGSEPVRPLSGA
jgi:anaerobic magnesium-protoporphyrin IX monomethyl ester cyclase